MSPFLVMQCWFCLTENFRYGEVTVLAKDTSAVRYNGCATPGGVDEMRGAMGLAVDGEYCFVADAYNQSVVVFNWRDGRLCDLARRVTLQCWMMMMATITGMSNHGAMTTTASPAAPGQFNEPLRHASRYETNSPSSEARKGGRRIQILRLPR